MWFLIPLAFVAYYTYTQRSQSNIATDTYTEDKYTDKPEYDYTASNIVNYTTVTHEKAETPGLTSCSLTRAARMHGLSEEPDNAEIHVNMFDDLTVHREYHF